jgi:opacity protein-like surface antigen
MRLHRLLLIAVLFLTCGVTTTYAQFGYGEPSRTFEITPFGGTRFGGAIDLNSGPFSQLNIKSTWDYGIMGDVTIFPNVEAEFMWNRQPTQLTGIDFTTGVPSPVGNATLDMYQWGLNVGLRNAQAKLVPFVAFGLGFTHYGTNFPTGFSNGFAYSIGGGVKYFFTQHWGARLDVRYSPSRTTTSTGTVCDFLGECFEVPVNNYAHQGQANLGLIFRF